jgi:hypothetical protein
MVVIGAGTAGVAAQPNANSPAAAGTTNPNAANAGGQGLGSTSPATAANGAGAASQGLGSTSSSTGATA